MLEEYGLQKTIFAFVLWLPLRVTDWISKSQVHKGLSGRKKICYINSAPKCPCPCCINLDFPSSQSFVLSFFFSSSDLWLAFPSATFFWNRVGGFFHFFPPTFMKTQTFLPRTSSLVFRAPKRITYFPAYLFYLSLASQNLAPVGYHGCKCWNAGQSTQCSPVKKLLSRTANMATEVTCFFENKSWSGRFQCYTHLAFKRKDIKPLFWQSTTPCPARS